LAAAVAGLALTFGTWLAIPETAVPGAAPLQWVLQGTAELHQGVVRDHLHARGANVQWGYDLGVVLMVALVLILVMLPFQSSSGSSASQPRRMR
jgi:hypothetical protein